MTISASTISSAAAALSPSTLPTTSTPISDGSGTVNVSWQLQASWQAGYVAQLIVGAPTAPAATRTISWPDPHAIGVANAWGMQCTAVAGVVNCTGADWATAVPAGGSATVGLQVINDGTAPSAPALTVS